MTRTYYECLNSDDKPATPRQAANLGTPRYGYRSRIVAELNCPAGCDVCERHTDGSADWAGRMVSYRTDDGRLVRVIPAPASV